MSNSKIYQFRCTVKNVSPLILRRLLVKGNSSIADLHHILQMSFGWSNTYLHCFNIRGKEYGIGYDGGMGFEDNPRAVLLDGFNFDLGEKFTYEYNFNDDWEIQIIVEKTLKPDLKKIYPFCISGSRAGPPEDCGGVESYMEQANCYGGEMALLTLINRLDDFKNDDDINNLRDFVENLQYWANMDHFNRKGLNVLLAKYGNKDPSWKEYMEEGFTL